MNKMNRGQAGRNRHDRGGEEITKGRYKTNILDANESSGFK